MRREYLMRAKVWKPGTSVAGFLWSYKYDGQRAFWDGGLSRGRAVDSVFWARPAVMGNGKVRFTQCTGLYSRYGNVIPAPDWWLDALPLGVMLDGELVVGPGPSLPSYSYSGLQSVRRIVGRNDGDWSSVFYGVIDLPGDGFWVPGTTSSGVRFPGPSTPDGLFVDNYDILGTLDLVPSAFRVEQHRLEDEPLVVASRIVAAGGEGIMLRRLMSVWEPKVTGALLKVKGVCDAEGVVVRVNGGVGRLVGMMGSLTVTWDGGTVDVGTGFSDRERSLSWKLGTTVLFRYNGLTEDGVPREARFVAIREGW